MAWPTPLYLLPNVKKSPDERFQAIVEYKNKQIDQYLQELKEGKWKTKFDEVIKQFKEAENYNKTFKDWVNTKPVYLCGCAQHTYTLCGCAHTVWRGCAMQFCRECAVCVRMGKYQVCSVRKIAIHKNLIISIVLQWFSFFSVVKIMTF